MSITNDFIRYLRSKGHQVIDRRRVSLGSNNHNRSLSGLRKGATHWDGVAFGTITGHENHWKNTLGWLNGGYTIFIHNNGKIYVNYDFEKRTNGVGGHNTPTLNFCYGGIWSNPMNAKQKQAMKDAWTFVVNDKRININSFNDVLGHNEFSGHASNDCPGINMNTFRNYLKSGDNAAVTVKPITPTGSKTTGGLYGAKLIKKEEAQFTVTEDAGIKVRSAPSTEATHTGTLKKGSRINYNAVYEGNGYRWLRYTGNSGNTLFVPYRPSNDLKSQWGVFGDIGNTENTPALPKDSSEQVARDIASGSHTWGNDPERSQNLKKAGYNPEWVQARVNQLLGVGAVKSKSTTSVAGAKLVKNESANFTTNTAIKVRNAPSTKATHTGTLPSGATIRYDRVYEGNGYRWLSYIGGSGNRLYVPYRPINNKKSWGTFH